MQGLTLFGDKPPILSLQCSPISLKKFLHHQHRDHPNQHHHEKPRASPAPTGQSVSIHRNGFAHQGKPRTLYKAV